MKENCSFPYLEKEQKLSFRGLFKTTKICKFYVSFPPLQYYAKFWLSEFLQNHIASPEEMNFSSL